MVGKFINEVLNPARLAALRRLGLLDTPAEAAFDRLGTLAAKVLQAPVALVTLVDDNRQFFKSCRGLEEPWASWRDTPLSHSFCQHVLTTREPLIIGDARIDGRFAENLAIRDLGVIAYLGIPLVLNTGEVLGSFCVIDHQPRIWTPEEVENLSLITSSVMTEIELRSEIRHKKAALDEIEMLNRQLAEKSASLETAKKDLESFNHSLSHDLRSPMATLVTFSQFMREECSHGLSSDCQEYLQFIVQGASRMKGILEGLEELCGVTKAEMKLSEVDLGAIAKTIFQGLRASAPERQVAIQIGDRMKTTADPRLMQVALENLLGNAWKFTSNTTDAQIKFDVTEKDGKRIYWVQDNGAGFDSGQTAKLFQAFERLHSQQEFPGTGIGLATVKRVIERHQGRVWADSLKRDGATFYFTLCESGPGGE